jgi:hypothetical protein
MNQNHNPDINPETIGEQRAGKVPMEFAGQKLTGANEWILKSCCIS